MTASPVSKLRDTYHARMLDLVKEAFNTEEQELFVAKFYCYLNHDPSSEHVVDLDGVWEWLGYSQKVVAKRKLQHTFVYGNDFIVMRGIRDDAPGRGGHNRERIMMTVETFKGLCILSETSKGAAVRRYYMKLEAILHAVLDEQTAELASQLSAETAKASQLQQRVEHTERRRRALNVKGQAVYISGDDDHTRHKIGKAVDSIKTREATGGTFNPSYMMRHAVTCVDAKLLEEVVFHRLRHIRICSARTGNKTEWFTISLSDAIAVVEEAQEWLDEIHFDALDEQAALDHVTDGPASQSALPQRRLRMTYAERETSRVAVNQSHEAYLEMNTRLRNMQESINNLALSSAASAVPASTSAMPASTSACSASAPCPTVKFTIPDIKNKRVVQYTLDGKFVRSWHNAAIAAKSGLFGQGAYSNIRGAVQGAATQARGFIWRHEDGVVEKEVEYRTDGDYKQLRPDGSLVTTYTSLASAAKAVVVDYYAVRNIFISDELFKGYRWETDQVIEPLAARPRRIRRKASSDEIESP